MAVRIPFLVSAPSGLAKGLERALGVEAVKLDVPYHAPGVAWLLNPRRLEIVLTAAVYPGIHLRSASKLLLSPLPSLRFHVQKLEDQKLLRVRREGTRAHLFLPGIFPVKAEPFLIAWSDPLDRRVLNLVRGAPPAARSVLARQIIPDGRQLDVSLRRLRALRAIRVAGSRSDPAYAPTTSWIAFERTCRDGAGDRVQALLGLLREQGLRPTLEEMTATAARVSVDGPRFRVRFSLPLDPLVEAAPG